MPTGPRPAQSARQRASQERKAAWAAARAAGVDPNTTAPDLPVVVGDAGMRVDALREAAKAAGVRPDVIAALVKRVQASDPAVVKGPVKRLQGQDLIDAFQDRLSMVLDYVDPVAMQQASLKDLAIAAGVFTDKVQLLKNMPTQIIDFSTRQQLHDLGPRLMAEMKRRGVTLEGEAKRVEGQTA